MGRLIGVAEFAGAAEAVRSELERVSPSAAFGVSERLIAVWKKLDPHEHVVVKDPSLRRQLVGALSIGMNICQWVVAQPETDPLRVSCVKPWIEELSIEALWHELQDPADSKEITPWILRQQDLFPDTNLALIRKGRIKEGEGTKGVMRHLSLLALRACGSEQQESHDIQQPRQAWRDTTQAAIDYAKVLGSYIERNGNRSEDEAVARGLLFRVLHFGGLAARAYVRGGQEKVRFALSRERAFHLVRLPAHQDPCFLHCKFTPPKDEKKHNDGITRLHGTAAFGPLLQGTRTTLRALGRAIAYSEPPEGKLIALDRLDTLLGAQSAERI